MQQRGIRIRNASIPSAGVLLPARRNSRFRFSNAVRRAHGIAHEMGHSFGRYHVPSRGVGGKFCGLQDRVDQSYPYGGGGLAGGWGYSALGNCFLAEDSHTFANHISADGKHWQAHWDSMSYTAGAGPWDTRYSDVYAEALRPKFSGSTPSFPPPPPVIPFAVLPCGISVLDAQCAAQIQTMLAAPTQTSQSAASASATQTSTTSVVTTPRVYAAPAAPAADPLNGVDPTAGDPDDETPEPPILIVTKVPVIPGLTAAP